MTATDFSARESRIRVLLLSVVPSYVETIRQALGSEPDVVLTTRLEGVEALGRTDDVADQDVVIVQMSGRELDRFQILAHYAQWNPATAIVLATPYKDADMMVLALRSGVREFLFEPLQQGEVAALVRRLGQKGTAGGAPHHGKVMAFMACKGGSGTTFLATNVAHTLARQGQKVLLIDLNLHSGDAYLFLMDRPPPTSLADICENFARLDGRFLETSAVKTGAGLHFLSSPSTPTQVDLIKTQHVVGIVELARSLYDYIVLDIDRYLDAIAIKALDLADEVYPVLQSSLPYLHDAQRMKDLFRSMGYAEGKVRWIVNRDDGGRHGVGMNNVRQVIGEAYWVVPNDHVHVEAAVNQGVPLTELAGHTAVAKSIIGLAGAIAGDGQDNDRTAKGWFGFLRRKESRRQD